MKSILISCISFLGFAALVASALLMFRYKSDQNYIDHFLADTENHITYTPIDKPEPSVQNTAVPLTKENASYIMFGDTRIDFPCTDSDLSGIIPSNKSPIASNEYVSNITLKQPTGHPVHFGGTEYFTLDNDFIGTPEWADALGLEDTYNPRYFSSLEDLYLKDSLEEVTGEDSFSSFQTKYYRKVIDCDTYQETVYFTIYLDQQDHVLRYDLNLYFDNINLPPHRPEEKK